MRRAIGRSASSALFLLLPLLVVFAEAFAQGWAVYVEALCDEPDALSAIRLTLLVAVIVVPINTVFGVLAAWAIAKFQFVGKSVLITLDRPAVQRFAGDRRHDLRAAVRRCRAGSGRGSTSTTSRSSSRVPGIVLATLFVTFPFVARELIPLMQAQGTEEEEAALVLGRRRAADVLARDAAEHQVGPALRRDPLQRPRDGRVRRGVGRLRPHPRPDQHHAAARRDAVQRHGRKPRRGLRRRLAAGDVGADYAGAQVAVAVEDGRATSADELGYTGD